MQPTDGYKPVKMQSSVNDCLIKNNIVMKKVTINLYSFAELNESAKQNAINEHRDFELSVMCPDDFISGEPEYDTEEELLKAYNEQYSYFMQNDDPIIEALEANEYLFFANGKLAKCTQYTGSHHKSGMTEFSMEGDVYCLI